MPSRCRAGCFLLLLPDCFASVKVVPADEAMAPILLVDGQTAGVVPKGDYNVESRIYEGAAPARGSW